MNDAQGGIQIQSATKNQKIRVFPKALQNALFAVAFGSIAIVSVHAGRRCYECPDGTMVEFAKDCPDPAFLGVDQQPKKSLAVRRVKETKLPDKTEVESLNAAEMSIWQEFEQSLQKNPKTAFRAAMEIWSGNYSDSLQRISIYRARALVRSTGEIENLSFLLACLEDSEAQKEKCLNLGKGNGLERKLAARRLALLTSNPKFANL